MSLLGAAPKAHVTIQALKAKGYAHWKAAKTIDHGHFDDLKYDDGRHRVWVSRMTLADYDGNRRAFQAERITYERYDRSSGRWVRA